MKKTTLYTAITIGLAVPGVTWVSTLMPSLPWSVYLYEVGRLLALLGFVLVFFQYVLSSKVSWIERGIGPGTLFKAHRKLGLIALVLILIHPVFLLLSEKIQGHSAPANPLRLLGALTLVVLCLASLAALLARRLRMKYQTWKRIHKAAYAVFPLAFAHSFLIGGTLQKWPARVLWLVLGAGYAVILLRKALRGSPSGRQP